MGVVIAAVDDELRFLELIRIALEREGFAVRCFESGDQLLDYFENAWADLVILDIRMPGMDGFEVCRRLRSMPRTSKTPIVFLSAQDEVLDKVLGLELGADDFLAKPFHPRELGARVRAVLRRLKPAEPSVRAVGELEIDMDRVEARYRGVMLNLTTAEFRILSLLAQRPGAVLTRERLIDGMWDGDRIVTDRTVDVHIRRLREKLGPGAHLVRTVRSVGYKIEE